MVRLVTLVFACFSAMDEDYLRSDHNGATTFVQRGWTHITMAIRTNKQPTPSSCGNIANRANGLSPFALCRVANPKVAIDHP